uniref:Terpene synthase N-terminal domain-containing protein n=1 Tax=Manihot esculenta TaxID=3983 RepID=A0A2C9U3Q6_MANES
MAKTEQETFRPYAYLPPATIWGCSFSSFSSQDSELIQSYTKEVEALKETVYDILLRKSTGGLIDNIEFINLLHCLGVSYHFENEIENQLHHIFIALQEQLDDDKYDLYAVALVFRILRQHGYKISCDVFKKFQDSDGEFSKINISDVKGLLSLYEASFLSVHGEYILDKALAFTRKHLETLADQSSPHLAKHIRNCLLWPFHQTMERLKALQYISFYEEDESRNETLLKFAKLDYNRLQLLYREELSLLSRWWNDMNLVEKLPYMRDRIVECYIWALGSIFEPQFAASRLLISKYVQMTTAVDDTYDAYGTLDELQRFTAAFERCNIDASDELPEYMKNLYKALLKLFEETDDCGNEYKTSYSKEMLKELMRSYLVEAQWVSDGCVPAFDEYMQNGLIVSTCDFLTSGFLLGMKDFGMKEIVWIRSNPKIVNAAKLIFNLRNDIVGHEESGTTNIPRDLL